MILLQNAVIVTSGKEAEGSILIDGDRIAGVFWNDSQDYAFRISRLIEQNPDIARPVGSHCLVTPRAHFRTANVGVVGNHQIGGRLELVVYVVLLEFFVPRAIVLLGCPEWVVCG